MTRRTDPILTNVLETIGQSAQIEKRSALYRWMRQHHDQLRDAMGSGVGLDGWEKLVAQFTEAGLTNRTGKPLTVHTARKTWWQVRKDMATKPKHEPTPSPKPLSVPAPPTITMSKRTVDARPIPQEKSESQPTPVTGDTTLDEFWKLVDSR